MALSQTSVLKLYNTVIEDVISGVREAFLDEGVDEQVLQELKQIWETKLMASKAVEINPEPPEPQPPQLTKNSSSSKGGSKRNANAQANAQPHTKEPTPPRPQPQPQPPQQAPAPQPTHAPAQQVQHPSQQQNQTQQIPQTQPQQVQHVQNMPVQQQMQQQQHHHQSLPQTQQPRQQPQQQPQQQPHVNQQATAVPADRQISIQIKLPVHGQLPERLITVHVPASAVQGNQLHALFTGPIISAAIALPTPFATSLLQQHVNSTFENVPGFTPVQVQPVQVVDQGANNIMQQQLIQGQAHGNMAQLDGAMDVDVRREGGRNNLIPNKTIQIKLPVQQQLQLPERLVVVQVPATIIQGNQLQKLFSDSIISAATMLPVVYATNFLQHYVNSVVSAQSFTPAQVQPLHAVQQQFYQGQAHGSMAQLDGTAHDFFDDGDMVIEEENSCSSNETQLIAIKIKLPAYNQKPERVVTLQYPASIANETKESVLHQIKEVPSGPAIAAALELPSGSRSSFFQLLKSQIKGIIQIDGPANDSSDEDDEEEEEDNDEDDDPDEDREEEDDENDDSGAREEEPLNSEDDVTDEDPTDLFDTDNVVVCQYDKITRSRNKWKFYLKDGIMNLSGKDFVFQKANGDAEW